MRGILESLKQTLVISEKDLGLAAQTEIDRGIDGAWERWRCRPAACLIVFKVPTTPYWRRSYLDWFNPLIGNLSLLKSTQLQLLRCRYLVLAHM